MARCTQGAAGERWTAGGETLPMGEGGRDPGMGSVIVARCPMQRLRAVAKGSACRRWQLRGHWPHVLQRTGRQRSMLQEGIDAKAAVAQRWRCRRMAVSFNRHVWGSHWPRLLRAVRCALGGEGWR
jgi:hypothetical protein